MALRQVLIVDDEPDILAVGRLALTDVGGLEVTEAGSGEAALVAVAESRPDVISGDVGALGAHNSGTSLTGCQWTDHPGTGPAWRRRTR